MKKGLFLCLLCGVVAVLSICIRDTFENGHEYVDLGLPSGTRWATTNVGAANPEDAGYYFAWGETSVKNVYSWNTYLYGKFNEFPAADSGFLKYNITDTKVILNPEDDAAHENWGGSWRMPTITEMQELKDNCTWTFVSLNGVKGYQIEGKNGNSIFMPAVGYCDGVFTDGKGVKGVYWTSSLGKVGVSQAYGFRFFSSIQMPTFVERYCGMPIRAVVTK